MARSAIGAGVASGWVSRRGGAAGGVAVGARPSPRPLPSERFHSAAARRLAPDSGHGVPARAGAGLRIQVWLTLQPRGKPSAAAGCSSRLGAVDWFRGPLGKSSTVLSSQALKAARHSVNSAVCSSQKLRGVWTTARSQSSETILFGPLKACRATSGFLRMSSSFCVMLA